MIIRKYLHSCLLFEEKGKKLLIDPGAFCFIEKKLKPEDFGKIDVVIITHKHLDHYFPEALKVLYKLNSKLKIIAHKNIGELLLGEKLPYLNIKNKEKITIDGFTIQAWDAQHGSIPAEIPHNFAYVINDTLLHPGDSLVIEKLPACTIMGLPVAGPWLRLVDALALTKKLKPKIAIPIHDGIIKEFMLERMYGMCKNTLEKEGIEFKALGMGEELEV